jgi:hypothetical protein
MRRRWGWLTCLGESLQTHLNEAYEHVCPINDKSPAFSFKALLEGIDLLNEIGRHPEQNIAALNALRWSASLCHSSYLLLSVDIS